MKKTFKDLFKLATAIATIAGVAYVARDQIKAIFDKIKEVSQDDLDDDFDDDSFDDDSFDEDEIFHEPTKDDRDYVSINITESDNSTVKEPETPAASVEE